MPRLYHPTLTRQYATVTDEQVDDFKNMGWLEQPHFPEGAPGTEPPVVPTDDVLRVSDPVPQPSRNASKEDWVNYALYRGMDQAAAEAMSRDELATAYTS